MTLLCMLWNASLIALCVWLVGWHAWSPLTFLLLLLWQSATASGSMVPEVRTATAPEAEEAPRDEMSEQVAAHARDARIIAQKGAVRYPHPGQVRIPRFDCPECGKPPLEVSVVVGGHEASCGVHHWRIGDAKSEEGNS